MLKNSVHNQSTGDVRFNTLNEDDQHDQSYANRMFSVRTQQKYECDALQTALDHN